MTATTPRYDLTYPTGTDQVADTPTIFKNMADSVESALGEVDDRHTNAAVMPVVRPSLMQLQQATAITGQTGFVTGGNDDNGPYVWNGTQWVKTRTADQPWNGVWRLNSEIYTGRKWVDGRRIYMQVREYKNLANNSRTSPGISNMYTLLDAHVITQGKNGYMQPYLATDTYWHSEVTVTPSEILVRKGSSNTAAINVWIVFIYTAGDPA